MVDLKRVILRKLKLGIADGIMKADGQIIYAATDLRVGLFEAARAAGCAPDEATATGAAALHVQAQGTAMRGKELR